MGLGAGGNGILGDGTTVNKSSPVQIGSLTDWAKVAGYQHAAAIKTDGTLWTWGYGGAWAH
jgi:alpha-tubulin suppressor-like RCC1 family protein